MAISFDEGGAVSLADYRRLREEVGWGTPPIPVAQLEAALARSWNVVAREGDDVVGLGRLLDDGALYASIWDMIVSPRAQRAGIGTAILERLLARAESLSLVVLIATHAGRPLYERHGFVTGDPGSTAMLRRLSR